MSIHSVYSALSVLVAGPLFFVAILRGPRRAGPGFGLLTLAMLFWQLGKLGKNGWIPGAEFLDVHTWSWLSFSGSAAVYPAFLVMVLQVTQRRLRNWIWAVLPAVTSSIGFVIAFANGTLVEGLRLTDRGYYNIPSGSYWLYIAVYALTMGSGLWLLWNGVPRRNGIEQQARVIFWAALCGFALGTLEFLAIFGWSIPPISDLAAAVYCGIFYWAIYRYNYLGGRNLVRWAALRLALFGAIWIGIGAILQLGVVLAVQISKPWVVAIFISLAIVIALPSLQKAYQWIARRWMPVRHAGRDFLVGLSSILSSADDLESALQQWILQSCQLLGFQSGFVWLPNGRCLPVQPRFKVGATWKRRLESIGPGAISRRETLQSAVSGAGTSALASSLVRMRHWHVLQRSRADVLVPGFGRSGLELCLVFKEGRYRTEDWSVTGPLLEAACRLIADHMFLRRILREREAEKRLGELGLMAAGLAHEIKNPLEGIYGAAQLLQEENKGNTKFVAMVLRDTERLNDTVHAFLKFARPYEAHSENLDLRQWLMAFCVERGDAGQRVVFWDETATEQRTLAIADSKALHGILLNLTQNASRVQPVEVPLQLRLELSLRQARYRIVVEDQGPGLPLSVRDRLFEPFHTGSSGGNGLGLAISRKMARAMGGDLVFEEIEVGARFVVELLIAE